MALVFMDGFDAGDVVLKYNSYTSGGTTTSTRFSSGRAWTTFFALNKNFESTGEIFIGMAMNITSYSNPPYLTLKSDDAATSHVSFTITATQILLRLGAYTGSILASASYSLSAGWHYVEFSAVIDSVSGSATVRVNGQTILSHSGNTRNGGTNLDIDSITIGHPNAGMSIDDLYILDSTGSAPYNSFLGDVRVATMTPNVVGNTTQFTATGDNYTHLDELPYSATDYVSGAGSGTKDTYGMSDLPAGATTIFGLQTNVIAKKSDAGNMSLAPVIRSGSTDYVGTASALGSSDMSLRTLHEVDPATSTAWTASGVNNLEAGMEVA